MSESVLSSRYTPGASLYIDIPGREPIALSAGFTRYKKRGHPVSTADTFRLASISKTYLATAIFKLIEQEKISLQDRLSGRLGSRIKFKKIQNGRRVRIDQLLNMTSGIRDYLGTSAFDQHFEANPHFPIHAEDAVSFVYGTPALFAPGSRYHYSNTNYVLLGLLLQNLTQRSFAQALKNLLFDPLDLDQTLVERTSFEKPISAKLSTRGYEREQKDLVDVTELNDGFGLGDGGIISTASEVGQFIRLLFRDQAVLSPESLSAMTTFGAENYGSGVEREETDWGEAYQHNGTSSGFQGQYYYFLDSGIVWVLLTNSLDTEIIDSVLEQTMEAILESTT